MRIWGLVSKMDPDVISIGGDISYDNNMIDCYWTHDLFLEQYEKATLSIGRLVPLILGVGNHDVGLNPRSHRKLSLKTGQGRPLIFSYYP